MAEVGSETKAGGCGVSVVATVLVMLILFYLLHLAGYVDMSKLIDLIKDFIGL
ncbi:MAG: hypothetical protein IBV52_09900 [Candidatus Bathyarchaeota archaeon]